jgi:hypothetical protein
LRNEGLDEFAVTDISTAMPSVPAGHDVVLLAQMALTPAQVTTLTNWVVAGGRLLAMRPDSQPARLLGLTRTGSSLSSAYLLVVRAQGSGSGIVGETIQFPGTADCYTLAGATSLATL